MTFARILVCLFVFAFSAGAGHASSARDNNGNAVGLIQSGKTGAKAYVAPKYRAVFQAYLNDLEAAGARILFMGGTRKGKCSIPRSKHPCGMAIDACQIGRGIVDPRCNLPSRRAIAAIAARHGLIEGGVWCDSDYGHAEVRTARQVSGCGHRHRHVATEFHRQDERVVTP